MTEPIRTLRSKITPGHDVSLHIEGLKFHEPDDLHELHDRLSPEHIKQLTDESRIHFKNIEEVDRFLGTSTKRSRNPGTGLEPTPSPEEMRRKAGTKADEPESIQRGRFFQSDSYNPMKAFKDYIVEVIEPVKPVVPIRREPPKRQQPEPEKKPEEKETGVPVRKPDEFIPTPSLPDFKPTYNPFKKYVKEFTEHEDYEGNTLFAIGPDRKMKMVHSPHKQIIQHPDSFPDLNFGRPTTWEERINLKDEHKERPEPLAYGRIDHNKRQITIITRHGGPLAYGDPLILPHNDKRKLDEDIEEDVYNRLDTLKLLEPYRQTHRIYVSGTGYHPHYHTFSEHEKYLTGLLSD
jgi:hypothetical protein